MNTLEQQIQDDARAHSQLIHKGLTALVAERVKLTDAAPKLLAELCAAHKIIQNALAVMTPEQKAEWGRLNARDGLEGEGITRANERLAVITQVAAPATTS